MSNVNAFHELVKKVTDFIGQQPLDKQLEQKLNEQFPFDGDVCTRIFDTCKTAIEAGWMCQYEGGGVRYGRVIKPDASLNGFSVDVVDMHDIAGPHHNHPHGEIDLIMPLTEGALFDNTPAGWLVYGPDTAHSPTVSNGRALVLYLLPEGKIEFTRN